MKDFITLIVPSDKFLASLKLRGKDQSTLLADFLGSLFHWNRLSSCFRSGWEASASSDKYVFRGTWRRRMLSSGFLEDAFGVESSGRNKCCLWFRRFASLPEELEWLWFWPSVRCPNCAAVPIPRGKICDCARRSKLPYSRVLTPVRAFSRVHGCLSRLP